MTPIQGKDVVLQIYKGGAYVNYACAIDVSVQLQSEMKSTKTVTNGYWGAFRAHKNSYIVQLNGVLAIDDNTKVTMADLLNYQMNLTALQFRMIFTDSINNLLQVITGNAYISDSTYSGGSEGFGNGSMTMQGTGPFVLTNTLTNCSATIGGTFGPQVGPSGGYDSKIQFTGASANVVRIDYSVDGGGRLSYFMPNPAVTFDWIYFNSLTGGNRTIKLIPMCADGSDGTPVIVNYNCTWVV